MAIFEYLETSALVDRQVLPRSVRAPLDVSAFSSNAAMNQKTLGFLEPPSHHLTFRNLEVRKDAFHLRAIDQRPLLPFLRR